MTNKQLYTLCGVIALSTSVIANSTFMGVFSLIWFIFSLVEAAKE
jgi:hypothetical protein